MISLLFLVSLCGCVGEQEDNNLTLQLRADFLSRTGCSGTMDLTADYGQRVYEYTVDFSETKKGGLSMVITAPEEVAGITAHITDGQTALEYDGVQLETGPLNRDGLSPMDALPAFFTAMESGYIAETGSEMLGETEVLRVCCRDPELDPGQGLEMIVWFDKAQKTLLRGEVRSEGSAVIQCEFSAFNLHQAT
jgi:outer membrane lipoprotein-sorting protein